MPIYNARTPYGRPDNESRSQLLAENQAAVRAAIEKAQMGAAERRFASAQAQERQLATDQWGAMRDIEGEKTRREWGLQAGDFTGRGGLAESEFGRTMDLAQTQRQWELEDRKLSDEQNALERFSREQELSASWDPGSGRYVLSAEGQKAQQQAKFIEQQRYGMAMLGAYKEMRRTEGKAAADQAYGAALVEAGLTPDPETGAERLMGRDRQIVEMQGALTDEIGQAFAHLQGRTFTTAEDWAAFDQAVLAYKNSLQGLTPEEVDLAIEAAFGADSPLMMAAAGSDERIRAKMPATMQRRALALMRGQNLSDPLSAAGVPAEDRVMETLQDPGKWAQIITSGRTAGNLGMGFMRAAQSVGLVPKITGQPEAKDWMRIASDLGIDIMEATGLPNMNYLTGKK